MPEPFNLRVRMKNCFERVTKLMGRAEADPVFTQFIQDLGERPEILLKTEKSTEYAFFRSGLQISFYEGPRCFGCAFFLGKQAKHGKMSDVQYPGNLPAGISFDDTQADVRRKLAVEPIACSAITDNKFDEFRLGDLLLRFFFSGSSDQIKLVGIRYIPAWDLVSESPL